MLASSDRGRELALRPSMCLGRCRAIPHGRCPARRASFTEGASVSAYGPAVFLSRRDGVETTESERQCVLSLVTEAAARVRLKDENGEPARPRPYGDSLGVLLYSGYLYGQMPTPIQQDQDEIWTTEGQRVAVEVEKAAPGIYTFEAYGVEV